MTSEDDDRIAEKTTNEETDMSSENPQTTPDSQSPEGTDDAFRTDQPDAEPTRPVPAADRPTAPVPDASAAGEPAGDGGEPIDIYLVNDALIAAGWRLNSLQLPAALHFCVTRPNTAPGLAERFVTDLGEAVRYAEQNRGTAAQSGAMYGFGGTPAGNEAINGLMVAVLDAMHAVAPLD